MRYSAAFLILLILATPAFAGDEGDPVQFTGLGDLDPDDLLHAGREDMAEVHELLGKSAPEDEILAYAEDAAFEMRIYLRNQGYPEARIGVALVEGRVQFDVTSGPRAFLGEVTISGVDEEDREALLLFVKAPRTWLFGSDLYTTGSLEAAARKMEGYLRQHGYADAVVTRSAEKELTESETEAEEITIPVEFVVEKGPLHLLESVQITGNRLRTVEQLLDRRTVPTASEPDGVTIRSFLGKPFGPFTPFDLKALVVEHYGDLGYPFVEVAENVILESRGETTAAIVSLEIREGPKTGVRLINIRGNARTKDYIIRRELDLFPGDIYQITKAATAQRHLVETGLFRQVFVDMVRPEEGIEGESAQADLDITVEENEFRRLETMVGWGTWELLRGTVAMTWSNLWGEAYEGTVAVSGSVRGYRLSGRLKDPWVLPDILWDRTAFTVEGLVEDQERPTYSYTRQEVGLILSKKDFFKDTVISLGYSFSVTDVYQVSEDLPDEFLNATNIGSLTLSATRDTRNNPWSPTGGSAVGGSLQYANEGLLGGDLNFWRGRISGIRFLDLGSGFVLAGRIMVGAIAPFGATDEIPIQERFYLGGGQTVRSFQQDDLGPRVSERGASQDTPAGGEFFSLANIELRAALPLGGLEAGIFIDGGNVIEKIRDAGFSDYRFAIGAGLRYGTPIGPVRLDFGVNPNPKSYERKWMIFFAVGYPF